MKAVRENAMGRTLHNRIRLKNRLSLISLIMRAFGTAR
jgi:hypothetical protein